MRRPLLAALACLLAAAGLTACEPAWLAAEACGPVGYDLAPPGYREPFQPAPTPAETTLTELAAAVASGPLAARFGGAWVEGDRAVATFTGDLADADASARAAVTDPSLLDVRSAEITLVELRQLIRRRYDAMIWSGWIRVSLPGNRVGDAMALRARWGKRLSIRLGGRLVAGGPEKHPGPCLLQLPSLMLGERLPPGITTSSGSASISTRRGSVITTTITITNRRRTTLVVRAPMGVRDDETTPVVVGHLMTSPTGFAVGALSATEGCRGVRWGEAASSDRIWQDERNRFFEFRPNEWPDCSEAEGEIRIAPGRSRTLPLVAGTDDIRHGGTWTLPAGSYRLQTMLVVDGRSRYLPPSIPVRIVNAALPPADPVLTRIPS